MPEGVKKRRCRPKRHTRWDEVESELPPPPPPPPPPPRPVLRPDDFKDLASFIDVVDKHALADHYVQLHGIMPVLRELAGMVGMQALKRKVVDQVLFFVQGLAGDVPDGMHHVVVSGNPGTGKSQVIGLMARLYHAMGMTAPKTQAVLDKAKGGVLVIDEAYALGSGKEDSDSFSKECLNTINQFLTEHTDFLMIIAGYQDKLDKCFFSANEGLSRRFPYRYHVDDYKPVELREIFMRQLAIAGWRLESPDVMESSLFEIHAASFRFNGGDTENLLGKCRLAHARRVFVSPDMPRRVLSAEDVQAGLRDHMEHAGSREPPMSESVRRMYM